MSWERKMCCLQPRPCIFQPGNFTGCGSEGVKATVNLSSIHISVAAFVIWAKQELVSFVSIFRRQVFESKASLTTIAECVQLAKKHCAEVHLSVNAFVSGRNGKWGWGPKRSQVFGQYSPLWVQWNLSANQSVFYVCSHRGDVRPKNKNKKQQHIVIIYPNFSTGLWTIHLTVLVITSVLYKISLTLL